MRHRITFIPVLLVLLAALGVWSSRSTLPYKAIEISGDKVSDSLSQQRIVLLETLDLMINDQHSFYAKKGRFTRMLSQLDTLPSPALSEKYQIHITEASADHFLISAFSESDKNGKVSDFLTVDQNYQVHSNFPIPMPRFEHLSRQAIRHLRLLADSLSSHDLPAQTVFKDYFHFYIKSDPNNGPSVLAIGAMPPVEGLRIEFTSDRLKETVLGSRVDEKWDSILKAKSSFNRSLASPLSTEAEKHMIIEAIPSAHRDPL